MAIETELSLLRAERNLVALVPLGVFLSFLALPFSAGVSESSYSAAYASSAVGGVLLFMLGIIVFYTGESIYRDRDVRIESIIWAVPAPHHVLLLSKFLVIFILALSFVLLSAITAVATQALRGHGALEISVYLRVYSIVLLPSIVFIAAASLAINVLLREKYVAYVASIGVAAGLFYLYGQGYRHGLYNPVLDGLWQYSDLVGPALGRILLQRLYWLTIAISLLALAHLGFPRYSSKGWRIDGSLTGKSWAVIMMVSSAIAAGVMAMMIY